MVQPSDLVEGSSYNISENGNPIQARFVFKRIEDNFALFTRYDGTEEGVEEGYEIRNNAF